MEDEELLVPFFENEVECCLLQEDPEKDVCISISDIYKAYIFMCIVYLKFCKIKQ